MRNYFLNILIICFFAWGCASKIDFKVPGSRFLSPETKGATLKTEFSINRENAHKVTTVEVVADNVFSTTSAGDMAGLSKSWTLGFSAHIGILEDIDFIYYTPTDSPSFVGLKYQLIGDSEEKRTEGIKASVAASYSYMNDAESTMSVTNPSDLTETQTYSGNVKISGFDLSAAIGLRKSKAVLFYLNGYYTKLNTQSDLISTAHGNLTVKGDVETYGSMVGIKLGTTNFFIQAETGFTFLNWEGGSNQVTHPVSVNIGLSI